LKLAKSSSAVCRRSAASSTASRFQVTVFVEFPGANYTTSLSRPSGINGRSQSRKSFASGAIAYASASVEIGFTEVEEERCFAAPGLSNDVEILATVSIRQ
jgi:hypothetical protein